MELKGVKFRADFVLTNITPRDHPRNRLGSRQLRKQSSLGAFFLDVFSKITSTSLSCEHSGV